MSIVYEIEPTAQRREDVQMTEWMKFSKPYNILM